MKKTILISSLIVIAVLFAEAYRENLNMSWQKYQKQYKKELIKLAKMDNELKVANSYEIKMRQLVLPEQNKVDRCTICHVAMEDQRMKHLSEPLKPHPGNILEIHELEKIGCTACHDGQGRAITFKDALAHGHDSFWEKPALDKPFLEANCYRCHQNPLEETPHYNKGKELFESKGCLGCHKIGEKGGTNGPDLSNLGNANFYVKSPTPENREQLLHKFSENINIAYIYEAVKEPHAQPKDSAMVDYHFTEEEAVNLTVYLKSLLTDSMPENLVLKESLQLPVTPLEQGARFYGMYCSACHGPNGEGTHLAELDQIGPAIGNKEFLSIADEKLLKHVISYARGGEMPAFKTTGGLTDSEINHIVMYIQSFRSDPPSLDEVLEVEGNPQYGHAFFAANCASCHGAEGRFKKDLIGPTLDNPTLLGLATKEFWYDTIVKGRPGTAMPSWHFLKKEQIADLIAYLESLKPEQLDEAKVLAYVYQDPSLEDGEKLYKGNCASCHALSGEGGLAPSLNNQEFQSITDARFILKVLIEGREGTGMPSWNYLPEESVGDIIAYIKSWQKKESIELSDERIIGSERLGKLLFQESCEKCHVGSGSVVAPSILSKGFLNQTSDQYVKHTIKYGRGHTKMPALFSGQGGVVELSDEEVNAIVAYVRSFEDNPVVLKGESLYFGNASEGKELYGRSCAQCHGNSGEGGVGPAIGKKGFLDTVSDGFVYAMMRVGRPGSEMKSFPPHGNGFSNLSDKEASDIIAFLRSNVANAEKATKKVRGYAARGGELFSRNCAQCHGKAGKGGIAPSLTHNNFLNSVSDSYLQATMSLGRHGTQMRPMMSGGSGVVELSSEEVNDIIVYLRSLIEK